MGMPVHDFRTRIVFFVLLFRHCASSRKELGYGQTKEQGRKVPDVICAAPVKWQVGPSASAPVLFAPQTEGLCPVCLIPSVRCALDCTAGAIIRCVFHSKTTVSLCNTIMTPKIALITGGASGMGLAVAKSLAAQGSWHVHLLDIHPDRGNEAAIGLHPHATFHKVDVSSYSDLAAVFQRVFQRHRRLDFVFANAGIIERANFFENLPQQNTKQVPPEPKDLRVIGVNLNGVVFTSYLAMHYFRRSPDKGRGCNLVMTASCGGLYPSHYSPLYTATKHGVVGLMRSIATQLWQNDGIRVNAICPGIAQTDLVDAQGWASFPPHLFIPLETIARIVLMLIRADDGGTDHGMTDATGTFIPAAQGYGRAVEISGDKFYFREAPEFCDEGMQAIMAATVLENQVGGVLNGTSRTSKL